MKGLSISGLVMGICGVCISMTAIILSIFGLKGAKRRRY